MSVSQNTVLFIDDDEAATRQLSKSLERRGYDFDVSFAVSPEQALQKNSREKPEAIVLDLSLSEDSGPEGGIELLQQLREGDPTVRILVLTGHDSQEFGVRSLKHGAASFLSKPVQAEHLGVLLKDAVQSTLLKRSYIKLSKAPDSLHHLTGMRSRSEKMNTVIEAVAYAASHAQPVLLLGETGVGKGVIAQAIHQASSRKSRPFIRVQPRFGNSDLSASELFGHERGAYTGALESRRGLLEEAHGGTVFLDEVDELPTETQILLLHALQEKVFRRLGSSRDLRSDFRLIAASNRPLEDSLAEGKMRQDFYHRLAHVTIEIPPLRERMEDILELATESLRALINRENLKVQGLSAEASEKLLQYSWPGNIRELLAAVESAAFRAQFEGRIFLEPSDFQLRKKSPITGKGSFREQVRQFEQRLILDTLAQCENNQSRAAVRLQIDRSTMRRILERGVGKSKNRAN